MAHCSKCGFELEESDKFCYKCGAPVELSVKTANQEKYENDKDNSLNPDSVQLLSDKPQKSIFTCKKCGYELEELDKFCYKCGAPVELSPKTENQEKDENSTDNSQNSDIIQLRSSDKLQKFRLTRKNYGYELEETDNICNKNGEPVEESKVDSISEKSSEDSGIVSFSVTDVQNENEKETSYNDQTIDSPFHDELYDRTENNNDLTDLINESDINQKGDSTQETVDFDESQSSCVIQTENLTAINHSINGSEEPDNQVVKCNNCGCILNEADRFCYKCGAKTTAFLGDSIADNSIPLNRKADEKMILIQNQMNLKNQSLVQIQSELKANRDTDLTRSNEIGIDCLQETKRSSKKRTPAFYAVLALSLALIGVSIYAIVVTIRNNNVEKKNDASDKSITIESSIETNVETLTDSSVQIETTTELSNENIEPLKLMKVNSFDSDGKLVSWEEYEYDSNGQVIKHEKYENGEMTETEEYEYNSNGQITYYEDSYRLYSELASEWSEWENEWYEYEYDSNGNMTKEIHCDSDGSVDSRVYEYDEYGNNVKTTVYWDGEFGGWMEYEYDTNMDLITSYTYSSSGELEYYSELEYDSLGNLLKEIGYDYYNNECYEWNEYEYDEANNTIKEICYDQNGNMYQWYEFEYDSNGNKIKQTVYNYDGVVLQWSEYSYDENNNWISMTAYDSEGCVFCVRQMEYDEDGNQIYLYLDNTQSCVFQCYSYEYDVMGNLTAMIIYDRDGSIKYWTEYEYS